METFATRKKLERAGFCQVDQILEYVNNCENIFPGHQTDLYYVNIWIENKLDNIKEELSIEKRLIQVGFNLETAQIFQKFESDDRETFYHQDLKYWIDILLEDSWSYRETPADGKNVSKCEYLKWKDKTATLQGKAGTTKIKEIHAKYSHLSLILKNKKGPFPYLDTPSTNLWYHGTSQKSAEGIIKGGIKLNKGKKNQDFSNGEGFYMSQNFSEAWEWAAGRNVNNSEKSAAVLIFQFELNAEQPKFERLDLFDRTKWESVINFYRNGIDIEDFEFEKTLKKVDCIYGPMSGDGHKKENLLQKEAKQLCIRDGGQKMSRFVYHNLVGVAYIE